MLEIELRNAGCLVTPKNNSEENIVITIRDIDPKTIEIFSSDKNLLDKRVFTRPFYVRDTVNYVKSLQNPGNGQVYEIIDKDAYYDLNIDEGTRKVMFKGEEIFLTKREYDLLLYLYINKGNPVSRDEAVAKVWKYDFTGDTNIVDVYIRYLREKLDDKYNSKLIYTVRNKGYMIK